MPVRANIGRFCLKSIHLSHLDLLEAESIYIMREVAAEFANPAILYSIGKDSSVLLRLAQKAFFPAKSPFTLLHIDTTYKFAEMIAFRDRVCRELNMKLLVHTNYDAIKLGTNPFKSGTTECCALLKTKSLLNALQENQIDAAVGGARRDEEKSRSKERIFSVRDNNGRWEPENQRPEIWSLYNTRLKRGQSMRIFPLSNWTELDVWEYILREKISVVPLYYAEERAMLVRGDFLIPFEHAINLLPGEKPQNVMCRMRSLGCTFCTGAVRSNARNVEEIIEELKSVRKSERQNRVIDHDHEASMELKKIEGYF